MSGRKYSEEEKEYFKELYEDGYTSRQVAKALNERFYNGEEVRTIESVRKKAVRMKIQAFHYKKEKDGLFYCSHCRTYKEREEYRRNNSTKQAIHWVCRTCESNYRVYGLPKHKTDFL